MKLFKNQWDDVTDEGRNEIVFENRNKAYGAYELRKNYHQTLLRALAITSVTVVGLFVLPTLTKLEAKEELVVFPDITPDIQYVVTSQKEEMPDLTKEENKKSTGNASSNQKVISDLFNKNPKDTLVNDQRNINDLTFTGNSNLSQNDLFPDLGNSGFKKGNGNYGDITNIKKEEPMLAPEFMPEFVGGEKALYRFLGDHLEFPQSAKRNNISAKLVVGFIIEKDGSISGVTIKKCNSPNYGFEAEVLKAVQNMPSWKPGMQGGKPVRVHFNLPINFKLE